MTQFFANILTGINSLVGNYGWSMVIFTVLIKLLISPLDYKSRKGMRRTQLIQPEIAKLQKKYANDKDKMNQKMAELYRKENISPMSGCLPMLISMPLLFIMFAAMRNVANMELAKQAIDLLVSGVQTNESWLWIQNIWMPDSPFYAAIADQ
ncbi:MAG: YidC/Oxa1 family membrane protein insertase, partial [Clostridia bacterium]|nr:YidC/Oxa1 family membrane protein insertase [Clostridia bacterium]